MRKAFVFTLLMLFISIGALVAMLAMTAARSGQISALGEVGAKGVGIADAGVRITTIRNLLSRTATEAVWDAIEDLHTQTPTALAALRTPCLEQDSVFVWYRESTCAPSREKILQSLERSIHSHLQDRMKSTGAGKIPSDFVISIAPTENGTRVVGMAPEPMFVLITPPGITPGSFLATASYVPSFDITVHYHLSEILTIAADTPAVAACIGQDTTCFTGLHSQLHLREESNDAQSLLEFTPAHTSTRKLRPLRFLLIADQTQQTI